MRDRKELHWGAGVGSACANLRRFGAIVRVRITRIIALSFPLLLVGCAWEDKALYKDLSDMVDSAMKQPEIYSAWDFDRLSTYWIKHDYWTGEGHFVSDEAIAQIEVEKRKFLQWKHGLEVTEQQRAQTRRAERERLERERAESDRIEFEAKRRELVQSGNGTLRDKSALQVKKLVDSWNDGSPSDLWIRGWPEDLAKERSGFFSTKTFYKVFGEPERTQLISSEFGADSYYLLYKCKDGVVQIKVNGDRLENDDMVVIEGLNIF